MKFIELPIFLRPEEEAEMLEDAGIKYEYDAVLGSFDPEDIAFVLPINDKKCSVYIRCMEKSVECELPKNEVIKRINKALS